MAKLLAFENKCSGESGMSYWIPVQINLCKATKSGMVLFYGYYSEAARHEKRPEIASKTYTVTEAQFDEFFGPSVLNPEDFNPFSACYALAMSVKDTGGGAALPDKEDGTPGGTTEPTSFFADATDC